MTNHVNQIPPAAKAAADRGDLIEAIKLTREVTALGLKEAKDAVDAYRRGAPTSASSPGGVQVPLQAISALHQGDFIEAVKRTREATGRGLKESKEAVEAYLAAHPNTNEQYRAARASGSGTARLMIIAGAIVIAAAVYWWLSRA
jgi:ribosomal protein L7/L12